MKKSKTPTQLLDWVKEKDYSQLDSWTVDTFLKQIEVRLDLIAQAIENSGYIDNDIRWKQLNQHELNLIERIDRKPTLAPVNGTHVSLLSKMQMGALSELQVKEPAANSEYLLDEDNGTLALSIQLKNSTTEELIKELTSVITKSRQIFNISEPVLGHTSHNSAVKSLLNYRALMYLDICTFIIFEQKINHFPKKHTLVAQAMDNHPLYKNINEIGVETLKKWYRQFYLPKLLNEQWVTSTLITIRSEHSLLNSQISSLITKT